MYNMDSKTIDKNVRIIGKIGRKMDMMVHKTSIAILLHAEEHGDYTKANDLHKAMPKSARTKTWVEWMEAHGKVKWDKDKKEFVFDREATTLIDEAILTPFWLWKDEVTEIKPLDFMKSLEALINRAEKVLKDDKASKTSNIPTDTLKKVQALIQ